MNSVIDTLLSRRSVLAKDLTEPGPNQEELNQILQAAHRVPDHGKIGPWRFIIFQGDARKQVSKKLTEIYQTENTDLSENAIAFEQTRFQRAPTIIGVVCSPDVEHKVPHWEQVLCSGAVCQNILVAASSLGYGAQWLTEWYAYNDEVNAFLELQEHEAIAGFIYIGSFENPPNERVRPPLEERIRYWPNQ